MHLPTQELRAACGMEGAKTHLQIEKLLPRGGRQAEKRIAGRELLRRRTRWPATITASQHDLICENIQMYVAHE
jgi:hypothetical protein